jgi:hypothetical protein
MEMRAAFDITKIVNALLADHPSGAVVPLDAVGDAIGTAGVTPDDIDRIFAALEAQGRTVGTVPGGRGEANLKKVVGAARDLRAEAGATGPRPTTANIAARAGLTEDEVRLALALLRVMQR